VLRVSSSFISIYFTLLLTTLQDCTIVLDTGQTQLSSFIWVLCTNRFSCFRSQQCRQRTANHGWHFHSQSTFKNRDIVQTTIETINYQWIAKSSVSIGRRSRNSDIRFLFSYRTSTLLGTLFHSFERKKIAWTIKERGTTTTARSRERTVLLPTRNKYYVEFNEIR
jgi:hypothetical protein